MKINEIDYAIGIPKLQMMSLDKAKKMGDEDGREIYAIDDGIHEFWFFKEGEDIAAYIAITSKEFNGYHKLERLERIKGPKGSTELLITFVVSKAGRNLMIHKKEGLTKKGLDWLNDFIRQGTRGLSIKDQTSLLPKPRKLKKERTRARMTGHHGPTTIFISNKKTNMTEETKELGGLLKPFYKFLDYEDSRGGL